MEGPPAAAAAAAAAAYTNAPLHLASARRRRRAVGSSSHIAFVMALRLLVVAAAGGLGSAVVREALGRGHAVSVLIRSEQKLKDALGPDVVSRLASVHVGSGTDRAAVDAATAGAAVVISCASPDPSIAHTLSVAAKNAGAKLIWTAGASRWRLLTTGAAWRPGVRPGGSLACVAPRLPSAVSPVLRHVAAPACERQTPPEQTFTLRRLQPV